MNAKNPENIPQNCMPQFCMHTYKIVSMENPKNYYLNYKKNFGTSNPLQVYEIKI